MKNLHSTIIYLFISFIIILSLTTIPRQTVIATQPEPITLASNIVLETIVEPIHKPIIIKEFTVAAYCPCFICCGKYPSNTKYGLTSTGTRAKQGRTCAVDPELIPYGTTLEIEGVGEFIAEDTLLKRIITYYKGKCIDIYFDNHADALKFGIKKLTVWEVEK